MPFLSLVLYLCRVIFFVAVMIGLPLIISGTPLASLSILQEIGIGVITVAALTYFLWREFPRFMSVHEMRSGDHKRRLEYLVGLTKKGCHAFVKQYQSKHKARFSPAPPKPEIRAALLVVVHCNWGFRRKLAMVCATGSLSNADVVQVLWAKNEGHCGVCWDCNHTYRWNAGEKPSKWGKMGAEQQAVRGDRAGLCVPIHGARGRVLGVFYVDFDRPIADTGFHESERGPAALYGMAEILFLPELPKHCVA